MFEAKPLPARDPKGIAGKMGEIVEVATDGFTVVCADGRIKVLRVKPADGPKGRGRRIRRQCKAHSRHEALMTPTQATAAKAPTTSSQHLPPVSQPKSDIEISQAAKKRPILDIAREKLGIARRTSSPTATTRPRCRWTTSSR